MKSGTVITHSNNTMVEIEEIIESQDLEGWEKLMGDDIIL